MEGGQQEATGGQQSEFSARAGNHFPSIPWPVGTHFGSVLGALPPLEEPPWACLLSLRDAHCYCHVIVPGVAQVLHAMHATPGLAVFRFHLVATTVNADGTVESAKLAEVKDSKGPSPGIWARDHIRRAPIGPT